MSLNVAVLEYLNQLVKSQPLNVDVEGVEIALNMLAEALNIDLATISSAPGALAPHSQSLESVFNAGLSAVGIAASALEAPASGTPEHFDSYIRSMKVCYLHILFLFFTYFCSFPHYFD